MKKHVSAKKSKRRQLTRKNKRKTLTRKKRGGAVEIDDSKSDGGIILASALTAIVFSIIIVSIELNSSGGSVDHEKIQKILLSSINTAIANDILLFLRNIDFKDNVLAIRNLPDKLIDEMNSYVKEFSFLSSYINASNNTISLNFNNKIILNAAIVEPYLNPLLDKISELDEKNRIDVESIRQNIKILLK